MADRSVGARYESHESEAIQSSMFCCCNVSPGKLCPVVELVCFCLAHTISFCVPECHQKDVKSSTAEKVFFFSSFVSAVASEGNQTKKRSSRSPKELLKFVRSGWKILKCVSDHI